MRKNPTPGGTIVATASVVSLYPHEGYPEYCGAKAAVLQFMRAASPVLRKVRLEVPEWMTRSLTSFIERQYQLQRGSAWDRPYSNTATGND